MALPVQSDLKHFDCVYDPMCLSIQSIKKTGAIIRTNAVYINFINSIYENRKYNFAMTMYYMLVIFSCRYGTKGKIDLTVEVKVTYCSN